MTKKTYVSTMVFLSVVTILILGIIAMMIVPCKVLDFKDAKYPVTTPVVKTGGVVEFQVRLTKYNDIPGTVSRQLMNSYIYNYSPIVGQLASGEVDKLVQIEIPTYLEPGTYFLRSIYEYKVNPLRTERYVHDTESFEVIK